MGDPTLVSDNIVAYWTFDSEAGENDIDRIDGHVLTDVGTAGRVAGKQGNAADFPNNDATMTMLDDVAMENNDHTNFSMVWWLHCYGRNGSGDNIMLRKGSGSPNLSVNVQYNTSGNYRAARSTNGTSYSANWPAGGNWANGETALAGWGHRTSGTKAWVSENLSVYIINGGVEFDSTHGWAIGDVQHFNGWIDELMIFQTDVTADSNAILTEIYNGGAGHPYSYYFPKKLRASSFFFSLAGIGIPAATLAGLYGAGAVAL